MRNYWLKSILVTAVLILGCHHVFAQPSFPNNNYYELEEWTFPTNWLDTDGDSPISFTNIVNVPEDANGNALLLNTTNAIPAFLFYPTMVTNETDKGTNIYPLIALDNGSVCLWLNPAWTSTNAGGTGPGDWANLISLGQAGTNGSCWWAWYLSPDGGTVFFSAQTNEGPFTNYLAAPVSFLASNWYCLVLTYSATNSAFYTNGVLVTNGTGVTAWPGPDVNFFAIGSDTNGFCQAQAEFSDMQTYNWPLDTNTVAGNFGIMEIFYYGGAGVPGPRIVQAPSKPNTIPTFDAVTGAGFLTNLGVSATYPTSSNIWFTNYTATNISTNVLNVMFAIAGGSNNVPYDVFATTALVMPPLSNSVWYWMGQAYKGTNYAIPITNLAPYTALNLVLGKPQDTDGDGLTDAYELLVTHTNPNNPSSNGSGMLDGWSVVWGLNPLINSTTQSNLLSNYNYDPVGRLQSLAGINAEIIGFDVEGNIQGDAQ